MKKSIKIILITVTILILLMAGYHLFAYTEPKLSLFHPEKVTHNFAHMDQIFPARPIEKSSNPFRFKDNPTPISSIYTFDGKTQHLDEFLDRSKTTGFLVIQNDEIIHEQYFQGYNKHSTATSYSVAKSFVSTLVGIAIEDGLIDSMHDPITKYVPELQGSGFEEATIAHVLQMSSGVDFSETYDDESSDAFKVFDEMFIFMKPLDKLTATYGSNAQPGTAFHYASINTHALTMLVRAVTGQSLTSYLEEALWHPLGMENDAFWTTDNHDTELGFMGLNATLRDFAKLGLLYLHEGEFNGQRIVSASWVAQATTPDADFLQPGQIDNDWGYQYQWWIPRESAGDFAAIGIWGQMIYVHPAANLVIVKTSADKDFKQHEYEAIVAFRAIADGLIDENK